MLLTGAGHMSTVIRFDDGAEHTRREFKVVLVVDERHAEAVFERLSYIRASKPSTNNDHFPFPLASLALSCVGEGINKIKFTITKK